MPSLPTGTVTFLLTDLEGSTRLWEQDPSTMKDALAWHDRVVREAIERNGGYVFSTAGDAFAAAFADPMHGAAAAVEIQQTVSSREWEGIGALKVRMELDTGIAEERDGDYFGPPVNRASRIMSLAAGGEVLAPHTAADLLRHHLDEGIRLEHLGERRLKDVSRPETIFEVAYGAQKPPKRRVTKKAMVWTGVATAVLAAGVLGAVVLTSTPESEVDASATAAPVTVAPAATASVTTAAPVVATTAQTQATPPAPILNPQPAAPPGFNPESLTSWALMALGNDGESISPSLVIGGDGERLIAFHNPALGEMRIVACRDPGCRTIAGAVIDGGGVGEWPSAALGADGLPVMSYYDRTNQDLKVAHCEDFACSTFTVATVDGVGAVGSHSSLAIGRDRRPIISYVDEGNSAIKVVHCGTLDCTTATSFTVDASGAFGSDTGLAIGGDGLPIITYNDRSNAALKVAHCDAVNCSSVTITTVETGGQAGLGTSTTIGMGLPVISFRSAGTVLLVRCADPFCASAAVSTIDEAAGGGGTSVGFGAGDVPLVAYHSATHGLRLARCGDTACSTVTIYSVDEAPGAGFDSSMAILPSGIPILAYFNEVDTRAWVAVPEAAIP